MKNARLFKDGTIISAEEVLSKGLSKAEFVDVEFDFKVTYVRKAKCNGTPYFRLYYSRKDYEQFSEEQKTRYDILSNMRHYQESAWHKEWEKRFEDIGQIEKTIVNKDNKRKRSDCYIDGIKLCIEFQHSYIDGDFNERNSFYNELGIKTIWIYDLTTQNVKITNGEYIILENNAKGFFKIAEDPDNLKNNIVFIQTKDKKLYLIDKLERKQIDSELESTIRVFNPINIMTPDEFVGKIKHNNLDFLKNNNSIIDNKNIKSELSTIYELWDKRYLWMVVENVVEKDKIIIYKDNKSGEMEKNNGKILFQYVSWNSVTRRFTKNSSYKYKLFRYGDEKVWKLLRGYII